MQEDISLVTQLPSDGWFEGSAIRPNGEILATRLDHPELYNLNPRDPEAEAQLLYTFPNATGLVNLCPLEGCVDEYAVIASTVDLGNVNFEDIVLWRVSFDKGDIRVAKMAEMKDGGFCVGVMPATEHTLLVADSSKACVWRLDVATGQSSVLLADDTMKVVRDEDFFGMNRLRIHDNYVWFTNTSAGTLCRFPVDLSGDITATGPVEVIAEDLHQCDGLVITRDARTVYTANYMSGWLWRIDIDPATGKGTVHLVREHLVSPTAVELRYVDGSPKLLILCCGQIDIGWINKESEDEKNLWRDIAQLNATTTVTVTVTTETNGN